MRNENKFQIAGQEIAPGERWQGMLTIGDGEFVLPAAVLHGEEEGKTVLITAAVHAGEYVGVETAVELANELKIEKITGTVVIVKVVCPDEFEQRAGSLCMEDGKNLNCSSREMHRGQGRRDLPVRWKKICTVWRITISICTAEIIMKI